MGVSRRGANYQMGMLPCMYYTKLPDWGVWSPRKPRDNRTPAAVFLLTSTGIPGSSIIEHSFFHGFPLENNSHPSDVFLLLCLGVSWASKHADFSGQTSFCFTASHLSRGRRRLLWPTSSEPSIVHASAEYVSPFQMDCRTPVVPDALRLVSDTISPFRDSTVGLTYLDSPMPLADAPATEFYG